jgi:hypothetical protein
LIESDTLTSDNGHWQLARPLTEADIPSSLHGLINGRLDRLEKQTKRILQEASVIGRDFLYEILKRISELAEHIDGELNHLERLDLIRTRSLQPEIEYMFKHALTQEVVYNSLLKKERCAIHEQIAQVIETIFGERLAEFNETLAYHFARGKSDEKAVKYLIQSGKKSLARYAVEEAHQYFKQAYDILNSKNKLSDLESHILLDLLNNWGFAYYFSGEFKDFITIFKHHQSVVDSLDDKGKVGMYYNWLGYAHYNAGKPKPAYEYLCKSIEIADYTDSQIVVGYSCAWLTWTCADLGILDEGIAHGERALEIAKLHPSDQYLYFKSISGLCYIYFYKGKISKIFDGAERLIEFGENNFNSRSKVLGYWMKSFGYLAVGDMKSTKKFSEKAIDAALDPFYGQFPKATLGIAYFFNNQFEEAEDILLSGIKYYESHGEGNTAGVCRYFLAPIQIAKGKMNQGKQLMQNTQKALIDNNRRVHYALSEYILGEVNLQIVAGPKPSLPIMAKNLGFLIRNVPFASQNAEKHLCNAIKLLEQMKVKVYLGLAYLSLGLLHKHKRKTAQARQHILDAIQIFKECEAYVYLEQANEALNSIKIADM